MTRLRKILLPLLAVLLSFPIAAQKATSPKFEMRGAWIATVYGIDWPPKAGTQPADVKQQKESLDEMIARLHDMGFNAVFFHVRTMGDALYSSSLEPTSAFLTGSRGAKCVFDPLAYCVERAHELGMECHAWINPFRVSKGKTQPSTTLDRKHSQMWMTHTVKGETATMFNPAREDTRRHLCDVCAEIVTNYDVDGIIFDDYFYLPEFLPEDDSAADYADYIESGSTLDFGEWRRENINRAIEEVYMAINEASGDGHVRFGISPAGIAGRNGYYASEGVPALTDYGLESRVADSQYMKIYSDPVAWLKAGSVDYVSPQIYWPTTHPRYAYHRLAEWWDDVAALYGRHCFPSQTLDKVLTQEDIEDVVEQFANNRCHGDDGASGGVFYSAKYLVGANRDASLAGALKGSLFATPALMPPMPWKGEGEPMSAANIAIDSASGRLTWDAPSECRTPAAKAPTRYVVYAVPTSVSLFDALSDDSLGLDAAYILGITYSTDFNVPAHLLSTHRIAVTVYDRFGREWDPVFLRTSAH